MNDNSNQKTDPRAGRRGPASRRRVLKTALLGGASVTAFKLLPERWTRPVVEAVSLPAHAQTSPIVFEGPWASGASPAGPGPARQRGLGGRLLDAIVPEARAGAPLPGECEAIFGICIDKVDDDTIRVRIGFDGFQFDDRNVGISVSGGQITFNALFDGEWSVNGALSADGETWTGRVEGICPFGFLRDEARNGMSDPWQRIRTAVTDTLMPSARAGDDPPAEDIDQPWTALRNEPCELIVPR